MMRAYILLLLFLCSLVLSAQSIPLNGVVVVQNSQYETGQRIYVTDASIRAPFAKPVSSDRGGQFSLSFAGVGTGTPVRLTVSKPGLEVVNSKEIEQVVLGRLPSVDVVMADPEKLAEAQVKYYNIAMESITARYDGRLASLRNANRKLEERLAQLSEEIGQPVTTLGDAMDLLEDQRNQAARHASDLAQEFAGVNLDDASKLYRHAFELFGSGHLDSVITLLSEERLRSEYELIQKEKARARELDKHADEGLRQLMDSYHLKFEVLHSSLDYPEAREVMDRMLAMLQADSAAFPTELGVGMIVQSADLYERAGEFERAVEVGIQAYDKAVRDLAPGHATIGYAGVSLANFLYNIGVDSCQALLERSMGILQRALGDGSFQVAECHNMMGWVLSSRGSTDQALDHFKAAISMFRTDSSTYAKDLGVSESSIAAAYWRKGQLDSAHLAIDRSMVHFRRAKENVALDTATTLNTLAVILSAQGETDEAIRIMREIRPIYERMFGEDNNRVAICHENLAVALNAAGHTEEALLEYRRGLDIITRLRGEDDPLLTPHLDNFGNLLVRTGDLGTGMPMLRKSFAIKERTLPSTHRDIAISCIYLSEAFSRMDRADSASAYAKRAMDILGDGNAPVLAMAIRAMGLAELAACHIDSALVFLGQAQAMTQRIHGQRSAAVVTGQLGLAEAWLEAMQPDSALACLDRCLPVMRDQFKTDDPRLDYAACLQANAYALSGSSERARSIIEQHGPAMLKASKASGPKAVLAFSTQGLLFEHDQLPDSALRCYRMAVQANNRSDWPLERSSGRFHFHCGRVLFQMERYKDAAIELDSSFAAVPSRDAAWFRYQVAVAAHDDEHALDPLMEVLRRSTWSFHRPQVDEAEARDQLKILATRLGRQDVLGEFDLH